MTEDKDARYQFRLSRSLLDAAMEKARREDFTLAQVLRRCLKAWIEEDVPREPQQEG